MKQLVAILIAVLLPLQMAWGAAAAYCQHETTTQGARHFGHHTHVHADAKHGVKVAGSTLLNDIDCGFCHAASAAVLPDMTALQAVSGTAGMPPVLADIERNSAPQRTPDRPQWCRLA
ncbi:MAG: cobalt-zinc-cadmium resistance protein [Betaproteobacteria bacterium]|nr:cobalt-zinc-cadmium resistance protein [Betaproteobacteria bacterium]